MPSETVDVSDGILFQAGLSWLGRECAVLSVIVVCVLAFLGDLGFEEAEQGLSDGGFDALAYG